MMVRMGRSCLIRLSRSTLRLCGRRLGRDRLVDNKEVVEVGVEGVGTRGDR